LRATGFCTGRGRLMAMPLTLHSQCTKTWYFMLFGNLVMSTPAAMSMITLVIMGIIVVLTIMTAVKNTRVNVMITAICMKTIALHIQKQSP